MGPAAGLQVRAFARGQHPGMLFCFRKGPLVTLPIGPSVPFADVTIENVLDVLYNQVDGHCYTGQRDKPRVSGEPAPGCCGR